MTTCSVNECVLEAHQNDSKCILHCEKGNYSTDFSKAGFLLLFYTELLKCITEFAFTVEDETERINKTSLTKYLKHDRQGDYQEIAEFAKQQTFVLTKIVFPAQDSRDYFDYLPVLNKLGAIHFNICEFKTQSLALGNVKCFFQECLFYDRWHIYNSPILGNVNNVLYQNCIFYNDVSSYAEGDNRYVIASSLFHDCEFQKKIEFWGIDFNAPLFRNSDKIQKAISEIRLTDCAFHDKFILNNCNIGEYHSEGTVFNSKFEFKNNNDKNLKCSIRITTSLWIRMELNIENLGYISVRRQRLWDRISSGLRECFCSS